MASVASEAPEVSGGTPLGAPEFDLGNLARMLMAKVGKPDADVAGNEAAANIAAAANRLGPRTNTWLRMTDAADVAGLRQLCYAAKSMRTTPPLAHPGQMPEWFSPRSHILEPDAVQLARVAEGSLLQFGHAPLVVGADGSSVPRQYVSRFAPLANHMDGDLRPYLRAAREVPGAVFVLSDDIWPRNYCHWLIDTLPRLATLELIGRRENVAVALGPISEEYQHETLRLCGFPSARIIELAPFQALRAGEVLVTNDIAVPPHPAFKAAPWAIRFLRRMIGAGAVDSTTPRRLFVSRGASPGRRILNEPALLAELAPLGFRRVELSGLPVRTQAALFAGAECIVAAHGAGLANLVFARPGTRVLEIFPTTYGTPAYYVLAAGNGLRYAYQLAEAEPSGIRGQLDDLSVEVGEVVARCKQMLG
jgi:hypothetical protein